MFVSWEKEAQVTNLHYPLRRYQIGKSELEMLGWNSGHRKADDYDAFLTKKLKRVSAEWPSSSGTAAGKQIWQDYCYQLWVCHKLVRTGVAPKLYGAREARRSPVSVGDRVSW